MGEAKARMPEKIQRRFQIQNQGMKFRDEHKNNSPYHPQSHEAVDFRTGWLIRDLQLALCKCNPEFAEAQIANGTVTREQLIKEQSIKESLH